MLANTMDQKTAVVAAVPIFAKLEPRSLEAVASLAKIVTVPADTVLVREGEPAASFYVIVSGTIRIERLGRFVRSMSNGGYLGEVALVEGTKRTATAICTTPSGNSICGSRTGCWRDESVSFVCVLRSLATQPMSPACSRGSSMRSLPCDTER